MQLVEQLGFGAIDVGTLSQTRQIQPGSKVYNQDLTVAEARQYVHAVTPK